MTRSTPTVNATHQPPNHNQEVTFAEGEQLVSTTDLNGVITYSNAAFCRVAGYSEQELLGQNHNIIRHQDMPKVAFADLWQQIQAGKAWRGIVKNRTKSGSYYWVDAYITPIYDDGKIVGYQSVRVKPDAQLVKTAESAYEQLLKAERSGKSFSLSMPRSVKYGLLIAACALPSAAALFSGGMSSHALLGLSPALVLGIWFRQELFSTPSKIAEMQTQYDSLSRAIFSGNDDFSVVDYHLKMASAGMRTVLGRMTDSAAPLHDLADDLSATTSRVNDAIGVQNKNIQHIATAIDNISESARTISVHASESHQLLDLTRDQCAVTRSQLNATQSSLNALSTQARQATDATDKLSTEAETVSAVMSEISGIADQTNLLALNAAIEAARAGEHGRGFAVVADEVRALSSRTQTATEQIQASIGNMLATIENWQVLIKNNHDDTLACVAQATQGAEALGAVENNMQAINELVDQVSSSAQSQESHAQQTSEHIHALADTSQQNLEAVSQVEQSSAGLKRRVDDFYLLADRFKHH
ncbi:PAS domain-containing methyl-accepting chemotaxis protein (plasmid) [Photobacterium sp. DA100]|uniref:methyl-accepting chemotaxis protein n=1 Tax=Photobacterium sp. DA100 TaxID=3027472 RepID=UPI00247AB64C|nr:PAS domain-containing methyl-accepting chemotaxis protein [Photobacterium sp. DA100]WEM45318.1 PAS domain-containing methyl-accepting chemotaxis protein [Photobacterium sp. DA100]